MDKELFRKTEGKLYRYYKSKSKIYRLKNEISFLESKLKRIESYIKNTNVTIDYYQNGAGISERVQTSSSGSSYAETEICREIEKLEKNHVYTYKKILKLKAKIEELEEFIFHMEANIGQLNEEAKRFLELKYGDEKNLIYISMTLNMSKTTAYRKREELVENIASYDDSLLSWEKFGNKLGNFKYKSMI